MKALLAALLVVLPVAASTPVGCGNLCGNWQQEAPRAAPLESVVDAALQNYVVPRARRPASLVRDYVDPTMTEQQLASQERPREPTVDRLERTELRAELLSLLAPPEKLSLTARGGDIYIQADALPARKFTAGQTKARVNSYGTADIYAAWKSGHLVISETYNRRNTYSESYSLQNASTLVVTREVKRPGLKALKLQAVYHRD